MIVSMFGGSNTVMTNGIRAGVVKAIENINMGGGM